MASRQHGAIGGVLHVAVIWQTFDRWGRLVELTDWGWKHVLQNHVEVADEFDIVRTAVESPTFVNFDVTCPTRRNFYLIIADADTAHPKYVKVCIEYGATGGTIVTAYFTRHVKPLEERQWP